MSTSPERDKVGIVADSLEPDLVRPDGELVAKAMTTYKIG